VVSRQAHITERNECHGTYEDMGDKGNGPRIRWWIPLVAIIAAWVLAALGCGPAIAGGAPRENAERVADHVQFATYNQVPNSIRHLVQFETNWPIYILVSESRRVCQVPAEIYTLTTEGEFFSCNWRWIRPS